MRPPKSLMLLALALTSCGGGASGPPPEIQAVTATPSTIIAGQRATLDAEAIGEVDDWSWTLESGLFPSVSTSSNPEVFWSEPGLAEGTVLASNAGGDSALFAFSFTVQAPDPPVWTAHRPVDVEASISGSEVILADGRPAYFRTDADRRYSLMHATTPNPVAASDWEQILIDGPPPVVFGGTYSSATIAGAPARSYLAEGGQLILLQATSTSPQGATDWRWSPIHEGALDGRCELVEYHGKPAVVSYPVDQGGGAFAVAVSVARTAMPSAASDWATVVPAPDITGRSDFRAGVWENSLQVVQAANPISGQPARFLTTAANVPMQSDWNSHDLPGPVFSVLIVWGIADYAGLLFQREDNQLSFLWAPMGHPEAADDWTRVDFLDEERGDVAACLVDERPVLTITTDFVQLGGGVTSATSLDVLRSYTSTPRTLANWTEATAVNASGSVLGASPFANGNRVGIAYFGGYVPPGGAGSSAMWVFRTESPW